MNRRYFVRMLLVAIGVQLGATQVADAGNRVSFNFFKNKEFTDYDYGAAGKFRVWDSGYLVNANGQEIVGTSIKVTIRLDTIVRNGSSSVAHIKDFTMEVDSGAQTFVLGMWGAVDPKGRIVFNGSVTAASDPSHIGSPAQLRAINLPTGEVSGAIYLTLP